MTNARKSREKHRMEKQTQAEIEFAEEERRAMAENHLVFSCSGTLFHKLNCDGDCGTAELDPLDVAINEERQRWDDIGMVPIGKPPQIPVAGVPVDTMHLEVSVEALIEVLVEVVPTLDRDMLNDRFKRMMLERLTLIREANQDEIIEARRRAEIASISVPGSSLMPEIVLPDHIKRRMQ